MFMGIWDSLLVISLYPLLYALFGGSALAMVILVGLVIAIPIILLVSDSVRNKRKKKPERKKKRGEEKKKGKAV
jgi:uncharacterized metal-binding protein